MAVSFTIKTSTPGRGSAAKKFRNDKATSNAIKEELEFVAGKAVVDTAQKAFTMSNAQKLYATAMFFQWVVYRTPVDEEYERVYGGIHKPDDDSVRDNWYVSYGRKEFCSKDFEGCFETFNDKSSIEKIAKILQGSIQTQRNIKTIKIYNTHPRFSQLEYGEYEYQSRGVSKGPTREHGLVNSFSIQAPKGMLRLTEMEFEWIAQHLSKSKGLLARAEFIRKIEKAKAVPDKRRINAMYNYLKNKRKFKESDIGWLK